MRSRRRLVGVWALQRMHITPLWPSFLAAPPYNYSFLSNPVIDPDFTNDAVAAFFDAIERERSLPKVIRLRYLDAQCRNLSRDHERTRCARRARRSSCPSANAPMSPRISG